jgi:hypothetical protein
MTKQELEILKKAYKILKKHLEPTCKDYAVGCVGCQSKRFLEDFKSFIEFYFGD